MFGEIVQDKAKLKDFGIATLNEKYMDILKRRKGVLLYMRYRQVKVNTAVYQKSGVLYNKMVYSILDAISMYEANQNYNVNAMFYNEIEISANGLKLDDVIKQLQYLGVYILNTKESRLPKKKSEILLKNRVKGWIHDFDGKIKTNYDFVIFLVSILPKYALNSREHRLLAALYCFGYQKEVFELSHKQNKYSPIMINCSYFELYEHLHSLQYKDYWCQQRLYANKFLLYYRRHWYTPKRGFHKIDLRSLSLTMFKRKCNLYYDYERIRAKIKINGFDEKQLAKLFMLKRYK